MTIKDYIPQAVKHRARHLQKKVQLISAPHYCPVCESRVASFLPLPEFYRENLLKYGFPFDGNDAETCNDSAYSCPSCDATDRDRLCALFLSGYLKSLEYVQQIKIVDFAPSAPLSEFMCRNIKSSGRDIQYRTADLLAENVNDRVDITELRPYQNNEFDFFICSHVLEHVEDDQKALRELYRILKPGGKAILMVPIILSIDQIDEDTSVTDEGERWRRFGQYDHVRLYSKGGFLTRVREAGFRVHEYDKKAFGEELFNKAGISSQSVLYVVEK